ncbi:GAP family protein [Kitasatospora paranensis]|uniref:GAP family protein n=1 Tax=Kitasatospora paranensis TaxID=258053 RepID=A0ABW2FWC5_9ACTN
MVLEFLVIGTAISLGPLHNSAFILLLSADGGLRKGLAFILSWLACLVLVITAVLLLTGGSPPAPHTAPSTAATAVKLTLGIGLTVYGERKRRLPPRPRRQPKWMARLDRVSVFTAAGLAVLLQPWAMVGAGAATVVEADLSAGTTFVVLAGYCLLATAGLIVMELYTVFSPTAAQLRLGGLRTWMDEHQDQTVVTLSLFVGLWLVARSIYELTA